MVRTFTTVLLSIGIAANAFGQTPQPFPRAGSTSQTPPSSSTQPPQAPVTPKTPPPATKPAAPVDPNAPPATAVGFPILPGALFIADYEAGKGQRYYLFGTTTPYLEVVKHYQSVLKDRGAQVYVEPATHMFTQRFREETMAFPPGVTVKDWTSGGSQGYPNARLGGQPANFPTVIMIVPPPPEVPAAGSQVPAAR